MPRHSQPTPAERARTTLRACPVLEVVARDVPSLVAEHGADRRGRPLLLLDPAATLAEFAVRASEPILVRVRATSLRPVEVPDRVRARVELCGYVDTIRQHTSGQILLRVEVLAVTLDGAVVDPDAYAAAVCDPHIDDESVHLRPLRDRPAALARACGRVARELVAAATAIASSGLDRYGITVWLGGPGWTREIRLPFDAPVESGDDVAAAVAGLLDGASPFGT